MRITFLIAVIVLMTISLSISGKYSMDNFAYSGSSEKMDIFRLFGTWELDSMQVYYAFSQDTMFTLDGKRLAFSRDLLHIDSNFQAYRVELDLNHFYLKSANGYKYNLTWAESGHLKESEIGYGFGDIYNIKKEGDVLICNGIKRYTGFAPRQDSVIRFYSRTVNQRDSILTWMRQPLVQYD